ncbi:hypothetical protein CVT24_005153 [Panaeolus cyanescens]|uniref:Essential protein Yae1 N-terminal domain-containing protein n=1 Tax=Panaeolus cyanescens TaxID=181874 RepID=A0A409V9R5_9AGAR|nr:hypothetical protein CVT24_005153 [Panaeolus cyanescens]
MPVAEKPLPTGPSEQDLLQVPEYDAFNDIVSLGRAASASPSPLLRVLQDPSLLSRRSKEKIDGSKGDSLKKERARKASRSPRREHRSQVVAALAIAEEERQASHLKTLLRTSTDRLETEMRNAQDAKMHAEFCEIREKDALAQRAANQYLGELQLAQLELRRMQTEMEETQRELEEAQKRERRATEALREEQDLSTHAMIQHMARENGYRAALKSYLEGGREQGYEEGYNIGYEDGRKAGIKEGRTKGRKEGLIEGIEQGRAEERKKAIEALDRFLEDDTNKDRTRRWAQSIYNNSDSVSSIHISDSGSVRCWY